MAWRRVNQWIGSLSLFLVRPQKPLGNSTQIKHFLQYPNGPRNFLVLRLAQRLKCAKAPSFVPSRNFSQSDPDPGNDDDLDHRSRHHLKLMDFPELLWPSVFRTIKNKVMAFLIAGYYDNTFTMEDFLNGANQAISFVSNNISQGNFTSLQGLVSSESIQEIQNNYADLDPGQRMFIAVEPKDIFFKFIDEIGMMFDDDTEKRFVEITVVFQGYKGFHDVKENNPKECYDEIKNNQDRIYVCNYRFIREFTKGVEDSWTINKLNHFIPSEFKMRMGR
ncbi:hypothetical protein ScPMuIL_017110 [Solemya velum]